MTVTGLFSSGGGGKTDVHATYPGTIMRKGEKSYAIEPVQAKKKSASRLTRSII